MANAAAKGESMEIRDERIKNAVDSGRFVTPNIAKGSDGVYRWMYELNLFKNPTVLITVYKVLLITFAIMLVFFFFISIPGGNFAEQFIGMLKVLAILFGIFLVLGLISYLIYAAYLGGKYIVLFEMNEYGVTHTQMPRYKKLGEVRTSLWKLVGSGRSCADKEKAPQTWRCFPSENGYLCAFTYSATAALMTVVAVVPSFAQISRNSASTSGLKSSEKRT